MATLSVPSISGEGNLTRYLQEIRKFPMLEPNEEYMLAKRWKERRTPMRRIGWSPAICVWSPRSRWAIAGTGCRCPS